MWPGRGGARQAHRSFEQLVRQRICRPLGMRETYLELPPSAPAWHQAKLQKASPPPCGTSRLWRARGP
ncbi:beta-lactamase family protein [Hymenobacter sp. BT770]|uniref:beta-lactamase family protein n=1 Tax=Hymenobacter sp. BT770 TaxID=2886942 RepID=UPI001D129E3B|nr:beta-lactamase family protein [Hymenobacter sp. BT770]